MKRIAVILAGCGHLDGSEIREAVISLVALDRHNANVTIFAPNRKQHHVVNHLNGTETTETRNILVEAARIARGNVKDLKELNVNDFDGLVMPGGFGVAKNLANIAFEGSNGSVDANVADIINAFAAQKKPIAAICISPALVAKTLSGKSPVLTLGPKNTMLAEMNAKEQVCTASEIAYDNANNLISCPAYMTDEKLSNIADGIEKLITKLMEAA